MRKGHYSSAIIIPWNTLHAPQNKNRPPTLYDFNRYNLNLHDNKHSYLHAFTTHMYLLYNCSLLRKQNPTPPHDGYIHNQDTGALHMWWHHKSTVVGGDQRLVD
jgi:hypothetical protein